MKLRIGAFLFISLLASTALAARDPSVRINPESYSFAAISVPDLEKSSAWYQKHFGVNESYSYSAEDGSLRIRVLARPGFTIELQQHSAANPGVVERDKPFLRHGIFKFGVTVADVREAVSRLSQAGAEVRVQPFKDQDGRFHSAIICDDNGNLVQLFQPMPTRPAKIGE